MRIKTRSKYRAVPTVVDGIRFASKAEARRYGELKLLEKAGEITDFELQPRYELYVTQNGWNGRHLVGRYVADFRYREIPLDQIVIEDVKGMMTPLAKWKIKHAELQYGITVQIVK
jgi:hypothetical protein